MRFTQEELDKILKDHKHWLDRDCCGWKDMRANLAGADLHEADLYQANLAGADLRGANLYQAYLAGANLCRANLHGANLHEANLYQAYLCRANLIGANLHGANLYHADLHHAYLRGSNLMDADLYQADLHEADLYQANLAGAYLRGANLHGVDHGVIPYACPDFGMFIGFKKAMTVTSENECCIVVLEIPEDAKRMSGTGRKCRCNKAKVLQIQTLGGDPLDTVARSFYDADFLYTPGEIISVNDFDEYRWDECSKGIHFFINREEAVRWKL